MVEVLLSKRHQDIIYIRYSGETSSKDDDFTMALLKSFAQAKENFTLIQYLTEDCCIVDKDFFSSSEVKKEGVFRGYHKFISIGQSGIVTTFIKKYANLLANVGIITELYSSMMEFRASYRDVDLDQDFHVELSNIME